MSSPSPRRRLSLRTGLVLPVITGVAVCSPAAPASAASLTVTTLADSGAGSLRQALGTAAAGDVITIGVTGQIDLLSPLTVPVPVTVEGPGAAGLVLSGGGTVQVLTVTATGGPVTLRGVTVANGSQLAGSQAGAGIEATGTDLVLTDVVVRDSEAGLYGGGIAVEDGSLTLVDSAVRGNGSGYYGGGIRAVDSDVTISGSLLEANVCGNAGGALSVDGGDVVVETTTVRGNDAQAVPGLLGGDTLRVDRSTVSDNVATIAPGVGIGVSGFGDVTVTNSTITGTGGGVIPAAVDAGGDLVLDHVTVAGNQPGTATASAGGAVTITDSIVTGGVDDISAGGPLTVRHSLLGASTAVVDGTDGTIVGADPLLDALADNGGPTQTMVPRTGSPVLDSGSVPYTGTVTDQRGVARVIDGNGDGTAVTDLGAVEAAAVTPVPDGHSGGPGDSGPAGTDPDTGGTSSSGATDTGLAVGTVPTPVTPVPTPVTPVPAPVTPVPATAGARSALAHTGTDTTVLLPAGLGLLAIGGLLTALGMRRRCRS